MEGKEINELAEKLKATGGNVYTVINHLQAELEKTKQELENGANQYALVVAELEKAKELIKESEQVLVKIRNDKNTGIIPTQSFINKLTTFLEAK